MCYNSPKIDSSLLMIAKNFSKLEILNFTLKLLFAQFQCRTNFYLNLSVRQAFVNISRF